MTIKEILDKFSETEQSCDGCRFQCEADVGCVYGEIACALIECEADQWVSVEERLPEQGIRVLICVGVAAFEGFRVGENWYRNSGVQVEDLFDDPVTHWRHLPEPPEEKKP